jgi:hypothetical protein
MSERIVTYETLRDGWSGFVEDARHCYFLGCHPTERAALARVAEILADLESEKNRRRDWHDIRRHR